MDILALEYEQQKQDLLNLSNELHETLKYAAGLPENQFLQVSETMGQITTMGINLLSGEIDFKQFEQMGIALAVEGANAIVPGLGDLVSGFVGVFGSYFGMEPPPSELEIVAQYIHESTKKISEQLQRTLETILKNQELQTKSIIDYLQTVESEKQTLGNAYLLAQVAYYDDFVKLARQIVTSTQEKIIDMRNSYISTINRKIQAENRAFQDEKEQFLKNSLGIITNNQKNIDDVTTYNKLLAEKAELQTITPGILESIARQQIANYLKNFDYDKRATIRNRLKNLGY